MNSTIGKKITNEEANTLQTINYCAFAKDNIVLTNNGYVSIENLSVGNMMMTNNNTFSKVTEKTFIANAPTIIVHGMGIDYVKCTPNQKFLVRTFIKHLCSKQYSSLNRPSGLRLFGEPEYVCAKDLNSKHYLGIQIISSDEDEIFETDNLDFWWLCGTYVGDGCLDMKRRLAIITCNDNDIARLEPVLKRLNYDYRIHPKQYERGCFNVTIKNYDFGGFVDDIFGHYSYGKNIPYNVLKLPNKQLEAFFNGFLQSDGCTLKTNNNISQFTTVNRNLNCVASLIINKLYKRPTRLYSQIRPRTYIIEGRTVNQRDTYQLRFMKEHQKFEHAFIENGYIWFPFSKIEEGETEELYNIRLEDSEGFVLGNCVVKNGQD